MDIAWVSAAMFRADGLLILTVLLLGLCVGSFLNVVIHRLPLMMEQGWRLEVRDYLEITAPVIDSPTITLSKPDSRCPQCGHLIRWYENIPVVSYLFLRGKCSNCGTSISIRYPFVEILTALLWLGIAYRYGITANGIAYIALATLLLVLFWIDFDTQLLPDSITQPLIWGGILFHLLTGNIPIYWSIYGAVAGYLSLWTVFHVFRLLTGKEGMGFGDFKLYAALGAWFGVGALIPLILFASLAGAVLGGGLMLLGKLKQGEPFAFGPFLALVGLVAIYVPPERWLRPLLG